MAIEVYEKDGKKKAVVSNGVCSFSAARQLDDGELSVSFWGGCGGFERMVVVDSGLGNYDDGRPRPYSFVESLIGSFSDGRFNSLGEYEWPGGVPESMRDNPEVVVALVDAVGGNASAMEGLLVSAIEMSGPRVSQDQLTLPSRPIGR